MTKLEKKLRVSLRRLGLGERATILVAVSGGADSTALLDALARARGRRGLPGQLFAAHFNHLLRGAESEADEAFIGEVAARLSVPLTIGREPVAERARSEKLNLEATARRLRYEFLRRAAQSCGADTVATAHTWDDQAETILMRLLRGSGPGGLRGIHPVVSLATEVRLVRPLLEVRHAEVLAHCTQYDLAFRTDSSNLSAAFTRNRVRHELLPLLRTFNPRFEAALIRAVAQSAEDDECLNQTAAEIIAAAAKGEALEIKSLRAAHPAVRRRVLRLWLCAARGDLRRVTAAHLAALDGLLMQGRGGSYVELPGGWQAHRQSQRLMLTQARDRNGAEDGPSAEVPEIAAATDQNE
jgi:tRNA(Ile)-lysidine synthase